MSGGVESGLDLCFESVALELALLLLLSEVVESELLSLLSLNGLLQFLEVGLSSHVASEQALNLD